MLTQYTTGLEGYFYMSFRSYYKLCPVQFLLSFYLRSSQANPDSPVSRRFQGYPKKKAVVEEDVAC